MPDTDNALLNSIAHPTVMSPNLFDAYGKGQQIAGQINQNRLFQSQGLAGQAALDAIDPVTHQFDNVKYQANLKDAGPNAAWGAQAGLQNSTALAGEQQAQAQKSLSLQYQALDSLGPKATYQQVNDKLEELKAAGAIQPAGAHAVLTGMPQGDDAQSQATRAHMLQVMGDQVRTASERLQSQFGSQGTVTRPDGTLGGYRIDPRTGAISTPPQAGAAQGTSPETRAAETPVYKKMPDGTYQQVPEARSARPGASGASNQDKYVGLPNPLLGGLPNPAEAPAGGVAPPASPSLSAPPMGVKEAAEATATDSAKTFQDISKGQVAAQSRGSVLDGMLADTSQFTTGPGADAILKLREIGGRLGIPVDEHATSAAESFRKFAAALNANQGSDARLSVSEASNPHADLSPAGIDKMLRKLRGNEDYTIARASLAAKWGDKTNSAGFEDKVGKQLDPRTFQYDRLTPPQKKAFFDALPDKAAFVKAHDATAALLGGGG